MMKALLLVGSPRRKKNASQAFGGYLLDKLADRGAETETRYLYAANSDGKKAALVASVAAAELTILSSPLYVDSLPAVVIETLEILARDRDTYPRSEQQRFVALMNCGFPEPDHNQYALSMCRLFATRNGFEWAGGLGIGAGEVAKGRLLTDMGGMTANLVRALDLSAESLAAGGRIPDEAIALAARPLMPAWLYRLAGQFGWLSQARHYGVLGKLRQRVWTPVERSD